MTGIQSTKVIAGCGRSLALAGQELKFRNNLFCVSKKNHKELLHCVFLDLKIMQP
jgi:hypothetical protein